MPHPHVRSHVEVLRIQDDHLSERVAAQPVRARSGLMVHLFSLFRLQDEESIPGIRTEIGNAS